MLLVTQSLNGFICGYGTHKAASRKGLLAACPRNLFSETDNGTALMGIISLLAGWEQDTAAGNAVLANHLLPYLESDQREGIVSYIVEVFQSDGRHSIEVIMRFICDESRAAQLNLVAMACASLGIEPKIDDGIGWRRVKQPHIAGDAVKPIHIELVVKYIKRKTGVTVEWPIDDQRIDFNQWYDCRSITQIRGKDVVITANVSVKVAQSGGLALVVLPTGRTFEVKIPAGTRDGAQLRLRGLGLPGLNGGEPGDALASIEIMQTEKGTARV
jgi:hypothetical protein